MRNLLNGIPKKSDVVIVGGGIGGIFSAFELFKKNIDFTLLESGKGVNERFCRQNCSLCNPENCDIIHGIGGASLFSEGKLTFSYKVGGEVNRILSKKQYRKRLKEFKSIIKAREVVPNYNIKEKFDKLGRKFTIEILSFPQVYIGTDKLPSFVEDLIKDFQDKIFTNCKVKNIIKEKGKYEVELEDNKKIEARNVIISTGQKESIFAVKMARKLGIETYPGNADIGVRLECPKEIYQHLLEIQHDPKLYFKTKYGTVRTFCTNPEGYVIILNNGDFISANGNAAKNRQSENTNVALMYSLSKLKNPREFTINLCKKIYNFAKTNLILQDISEIIKTEKTNLVPTCKRVVKGNLKQFFPSNIYNAIKESLERLNKILDGLDGVVYIPEVKLYNFKINIQQDTFETLPGLYFIGDCAGWTHGIVNSALGGLSAVDAIIRTRSF